MKVYSHFASVPQGLVVPWWLGLLTRVHWNRVQPCDTVLCWAEVGLLLSSVLPRAMWAKKSLKAALEQPLCHHHVAVPQSAPSMMRHALAPKQSCTRGPSAVETSTGSSHRGGTQSGTGLRRAVAIQVLRNPAPVDVAASSSTTYLISALRFKGKQINKWLTIWRSSYSSGSTGRQAKEKTVHPTASNKDVYSNARNTCIVFLPGLPTGRLAPHFWRFSRARDPVGELCSAAARFHIARMLLMAKLHIWQQATEKLICHCCLRAAKASHPCRRHLGAQDTRWVLLKQKAVDKKVKAADSCIRMPRHRDLSVLNKANISVPRRMNKRSH